MKVMINGNETGCRNGMTVNNLLRTIGIDIPTACYISDKTEGGRCMACAVEINRELKPSCSTYVEEGMEIRTNTLEAITARKWASRFLLVHHPASCDSCHKLGECVLPGVEKKSGQIFDNSFKPEIKKSSLKKIKENIILDHSKCIFCGLCDNADHISDETVTNCPTGALQSHE